MRGRSAGSKAVAATGAGAGATTGAGAEMGAGAGAATGIGVGATGAVAQLGAASEPSTTSVKVGTKRGGMRRSWGSDMK